MTKIHTCKNVEDTHKVAQELAIKASAGSVFCLKGNLGAGKTEFAKGFIRALCGDDVVVTSPTFNIVQIYDTKNGTFKSNLKIYHYDLYRIKHDGELEEIGISESIENAINLIEWAEIAEDYLPKNFVTVEITPNAEDENIRNISVY